ncbi:MAG: HNH endonuclease signature motif containing protein [Pseudomonadota bacterium]
MESEVAKTDPNFLPPEAFTSPGDSRYRSARGRTLWEKMCNTSSTMPNGCIVWNGAVTPAGYGCMMIGTERWLTHRLAWIQRNGRIPDGMIVRHKICGNRRCMNVDHLAIGTQAENVADTIAQGRHVSRRGSATVNAKFTEDQIVAIRNCDTPFMELVAQYNVSPATMHAILTGKTWKHAGGRIRALDRARGTRIKMSRLNDDIVREIKLSNESTADLARRYRVSWRAIRDIRVGKYWTHVRVDPQAPGVP